MPDSRNPGDNTPAVLIVDPSKVVLMAARKLLEPHLGVYLAENGSAAWDLIESIPDITTVFTEQNLPGLGGIELLARIRESADQRIADMPVVITTSSERDEATRRAALDAGATDFIFKPFDAVDLVTRARAWSTTSQRANSLRVHNQALSELVMVDTDTRAGNRDYFLRESIKDRSFCLRHARTYSVLFLSIDNYERLLREQGRVAAREAIGAVADVIRGKCRREDTFARVGEYTFALSLLQTDHIGARVLAERIRQAISLKVFKPRGMTVTLTVSIGVSVPVPDTALTAEQVLAVAEKAAQVASRAGGNQTNVINEGKAGTSVARSMKVITEPIEGNVTFAGDDATRDPKGMIERVLPLLERLNEADRLVLIDRLLVMTETPSES